MTGNRSFLSGWRATERALSLATRQLAGSPAGQTVSFPNKLQPPLSRSHADLRSRPELSTQNPLRERVLDLLLDGALQGARAVHGIEAGFAEQILRGIVDGELHVAVGETLAQEAELDVHDGTQLALAQRMEHDDVVDAVDELRTEVLLHDFHDG